MPSASALAADALALAAEALALAADALALAADALDAEALELAADKLALAADTLEPEAPDAAELDAGDEAHPSMNAQTMAVAKATTNNLALVIFPPFLGPGTTGQPAINSKRASRQPGTVGKRNR